MWRTGKHWHDQINDGYYVRGNDDDGKAIVGAWVTEGQEDVRQTDTWEVI